MLVNPVRYDRLSGESDRSSETIMTRCRVNVITVDMRKTNAGFTLIELLMTIVIASIVVTLAVPAFTDTIRNNRLTAQSNDLVTAINLARAEAVKRRSDVTVCPSTDQSTCAASAWQDGWIVRAEASGDVIMAFPAMKGSTTVSATTNTVRYSQRGFLANGNPVTLRLCADSGKTGREITITGTGRPATVNPHPTC
jgi:type IV fimbrial biogenesis protein FimT